MMQTIKKELKKHIATIHCSNNLSLLQRKISNALLFHAYPTLMDEDEYIISIKELCRLIGYNGKNEEAIKNAIRHLITTLIEWNIIDELGQEDWTASTTLASVRLKSGRCIYAYSPRMKALLHSPTIYAKINLKIQSQFHSNYALALYENCVRYKRLPQTRWFDYKVFRKLMGVSEDKYKIFRDFNRRVLSKAVEEINNVSDIIVSIEIKKEGRAVSSIRFLIKSKKLEEDMAPKEKVLNHNKQERDQERDELSRKIKTVFGLSEIEANRIFKQYEIEYIKNKIQLILESDTFKNCSIKNMAGYLKAALFDDYQPIVSSQCVAVEQRKEKEMIKMLQQEKNTLLEAIETKFNQYIEQKLPNAISAMPDDEKALLIFNFEAFLKTTNYFGIYQNEGIDNPLVMMNLVQFVRTHYPKILEEIITFEHYSEAFHTNESLRIKAIEKIIEKAAE